MEAPPMFSSGQSAALPQLLLLAVPRFVSAVIPRSRGLRSEVVVPEVIKGDCVRSFEVGSDIVVVVVKR
ncbi:hypothetical protein E2C01_084563 [Portunus trituberculatus]|uniref:Uncharacterized protein n=1 Tax=Portunus trituberculatus TaxID=210409 RepID=A0A5B7J4J0_PORTR|nr:hypothetical protein [Portunus trituberculatus]